MRIPARAFRLAVFIALVPLAWATTVVPPSFDELIAESEVVVRGVVTHVRAEEFDAPQGRGIRTLITLKIERTLKGESAETITLVQLGGRMKDRVMHVAGLPEFKPGDRQIVFVARNGRAISPVIAGGFGRFPIQTDAATGREQVFRNDGTPLVSVDQISLPLAERATITSVDASQTAMVVTAFESRVLTRAEQMKSANRVP